MQPKAASRDAAIKSIERVLSEIGLHSGKVKIETDLKRSSNGNNVPKKVSIGGVKARAFLGFHGKLGKVNAKKGSSNVKYNQWKALHNAIKDHGLEGTSRNKKAEVWESLDKVFSYCDKTSWGKNDLPNFKKELNNFRNAMKDAWDQEFTHYMVRILIIFLLFLILTHFYFGSIYN